MENTVIEQANSTVEAGTEAVTASMEQAERTYTQADFDKLMAKTRGATEREFFKALGIENKEQLATIKAAYESSLSAEEKQNATIQNLQADIDTHRAASEENGYIIAAMEAMTETSRDQVKQIVAMAKGLVTDDCGIEDAIKTVIGMVGVNKKPIEQVYASGTGNDSAEQRTLDEFAKRIEKYERK